MRNNANVNVEWTTPADKGGGLAFEYVSVEILMDIRAELRRLTTLLDLAKPKRRTPAKGKA